MDQGFTPDSKQNGPRVNEWIEGAPKKAWFGFVKVRYRGLAKNATRSFVALGLANIYLARGVLDAQLRP